MNDETTPPGGGHTADSETIRQAFKRPMGDYEHAALAALKRLEAAANRADCDCVPAALSSKSCEKCGRPFVISQERYIELVAAANRTASLEAAVSVPVGAGNDRRWIDCPLCGSTDTRAERDGDGWIVSCVNLACPSNVLPGAGGGHKCPSCPYLNGCSGKCGWKR